MRRPPSKSLKLTAVQWQKKRLNDGMRLLKQECPDIPTKATIFTKQFKINQTHFKPSQTLLNNKIRTRSMLASANKISRKTVKNIIIIFPNQDNNLQSKHKQQEQSNPSHEQIQEKLVQQGYGQEKQKYLLKKSQQYQGYPQNLNQMNQMSQLSQVEGQWKKGKPRNENQDKKDEQKCEKTKVRAMWRFIKPVS